MTYGEQLKRLRLGMQPPMTQQHLADLLGVHVTTISRWETDQSVPRRPRAPPRDGGWEGRGPSGIARMMDG